MRSLSIETVTMKSISLSTWLKEKVMKGEVVLFLGAGASRDVLDSKGNKTYISVDCLKEALSTKYLDGRKQSESLSVIAEYAKDLSSLRDVQSDIKNIFKDLGPNTFHEKIAKFKWKAIVTTNYDLVIEKAYQNENDRLQKLVPIISNDDHLDNILKDPENLPYLKLHGCITRADNGNIPLILASEQYAKYKTNRENLFKSLSEWGREYPIIFCGYKLSDPNIQYILFDLGDTSVHRPRYVNVDPALDDIDEAYWHGRRFDVITATFEEFVNYLDSEIPFHTRQLAKITSANDLTYGKWFCTSSSPSSKLIQHISDNFWHVHPGMSIDSIDPRNFYKGLNVGWGAIDQKFDVRRRIEDDILVEAVIDDSKLKKVQVYLLKGYAGSGKSVCLKRVAWDAASEYDKLVFYLKDDSFLDIDVILELYTLTKKRLFIFIDDIVPVLKDVNSLIRILNKEQVEITIIFGSRSNEWNIIGEDVASSVDQEFELNDLSHKEINELLKKLEEYKSLGHLEFIKEEERFEAFRQVAKKQLLVALHEVTSGKPFEEIVYNEYLNILPEVARILYLDICTLNRLNVAVRAGLISRISEINFDYFKVKLLAPLEHVVIAKTDPKIRDFVYKTRHPLIAEMVFKEALNDPEKRADQLVRMIRYLNVSYQADERAFLDLIKGKTIAEMFADRRLGDQLFKAAHEVGDMSSYVEHQKAIFELNHPAGSLVSALEALRKAEESSRHPSKALKHTHAVILRRKANEATSSLEKDKFRAEAKQILSSQFSGANNAHSHHTYGQILIDELRDKIAELNGGTDALQNRAILENIEKIEEVIFRGLQRFDEDEYLYTLKFDLARIIDDQPKAITALLAAFQSNPRSGFAAIRLSTYYMDKGDSESAVGILEKCLHENPQKNVHLKLAQILIDLDEIGNSKKIIYHLKNSFTEGDANYSSQFWSARHHFLYGDKDYAKKLFESLSKARVSPDFRNKLRGCVRDVTGRPKEFEGTIVSKRDSYCHASCHELIENIFIYFNQFDPDEWDILHFNSKIKFNFGFTIRGPQGFNCGIVK